MPLTSDEFIEKLVRYAELSDMSNALEGDEPDEVINEYDRDELNDLTSELADELPLQRRAMSDARRLIGSPPKTDQHEAREIWIDMAVNLAALDAVGAETASGLTPEEIGAWNAGSQLEQPHEILRRHVARGIEELEDLGHPTNQISRDPVGDL